ncbi:MAG: hypothetical protein ACRC13_00570 [Tannerellaceae bacterium]
MFKNIFNSRSQKNIESNKSDTSLDRVDMLNVHDACFTIAQTIQKEFSYFEIVDGMFHDKGYQIILENNTVYDILNFKTIIDNALCDLPMTVYQGWEVQDDFIYKLLVNGSTSLGIFIKRIFEKNEVTIIYKV